MRLFKHLVLENKRLKASNTPQALHTHRIEGPAGIREGGLCLLKWLEKWGPGRCNAAPESRCYPIATTCNDIGIQGEIEKAGLRCCK